MNNQFNINDFDRVIDWNLAHNFCKFTKKEDKNGDVYFTGSLNNKNMMTFRKNKFGDDYILQIVPVTYVKKNQQSQEPQQSANDQSVPW